MDIKKSLPTDSELEDIALTKKLAASLSKLQSLEEGTMKSLQDVANKLKELGVRVGVVSKNRFRLVTHCWIDDADIEMAIGAFEEVFRGV